MKIVNFYDNNGTWICKKELEKVFPRGTELTLTNPSGLVYYGSVESIAEDQRFDGEIAEHIIGFWEWEVRTEEVEKDVLREALGEFAEGLHADNQVVTRPLVDALTEVLKIEGEDNEE